MSRILIASIMFLSLIIIGGCRSQNLNLYEDTFICCSTPQQKNPEIIPDGLGNAIVVWNDYSVDSSYDYSLQDAFADIYIQKVDRDLIPQWAPDGMPVVVAENGQYLLDICLSAPGEVLVLWGDHRDTSDYRQIGIYIQKMDSSGNPVWSDNGVSVFPGTDEVSHTHMISDGAGGAIVTWTTDKMTDSGEYIESEIYAQRVDSTGAILWAEEGIPVTTVPSQYFLSQMVSDSNGGAIISWHDSNPENTGLFVQRIDSNGETQWPAEGVEVTSNIAYGHVIPDEQGGVVIAWTDSSDGQFYSQKLNGNGELQWGTDGIEVVDDFRGGTWFEMVGDGNGNTIVAFLSGHSMTASDGRHSLHTEDIVHFQKIDTDGNRLWGENGIQFEDADHYWYTFPQLTSDGAGGAMLIWSESQNVTTQRVSRDGLFYWMPDGKAVTNSSSVYHPRFAQVDSYEGYVIVWDDGREDSIYGNTHIYGHYITETGLPF